MTEYYGNNDYRDYLIHFGVPGMKWGKHLKKKFYEVKDAAANKLNDARREVEYQAEQVTDKITGERSKRISKAWKDKANRYYNYSSQAKRKGHNSTAHDDALMAEASKEQSRLWKESYDKSLAGRVDNAVKKRNAKKNNRENNIRGMKDTVYRKVESGQYKNVKDTLDDGYKWHEAKGWIKPLSEKEKKQQAQRGNPNAKYKMTAKGVAQIGKELTEMGKHHKLKEEIKRKKKVRV